MIGSDDNRSFVRNVFAANGLQTEKDGKQYSKKQLYKSVPHEIHLSFLAKDRIVSVTS